MTIVKHKWHNFSSSGASGLEIAETSNKNNKNKINLTNRRASGGRIRAFLLLPYLLQFGLLIQIRERILEFERRGLVGVSSVVGQTCFAGDTKTTTLHLDEGPSYNG